MKIILFFGSFNPIHIGHLIIAQSLLNETGYDRVWLVVSPQNPFKPAHSLLNEYERLYMCELALKNHDRILASNVEFFLPRPSYTIDTLTHLTARYSTYHFAICMGEDNYLHFHKWKKAEIIQKYYPIFIYPRIKTSERSPTPTIKNGTTTFLDMPLLDISSSYIRQLLKQKKSIRFLVPDPVYEYIYAKNLYAYP
ncbi:MAG: nicotinate (nicotinamide) nucleotide adenylyltransferase [Bacteroidia bacterium]|nr:nicotinate (nicotinamide) nucleotide adenylyltransferase [Bacteroidia bacterium]MDW8157802.1 nicotinate (nicotinamide) nucleotide adenylyltransferase [Bacteroidia bacterium]